MKKTAAQKIANDKAKTSNHVRLVEAAIRCIRSHGISQTFIDDIAREAKLSRPTAYRTFSSRKALLESVAAHSADLFKDAVKNKLKSYKTVADAIALGTAESLAIAKRDKVFMALLKALGDQGLERYLLASDGPVFAYTLEAWQDAFAKGRAVGALRKDVTDEELVTLICGANCFFLLRDDLGKREQVAFLRKFLLPGVLAKSETS